VEESADETRLVEAATSPPSVGSPPWTRARQEAAQGKEEVAEEAARLAEELLAAARRATESTEVRYYSLAM
jgi:hypothetical protein